MQRKSVSGYKNHMKVTKLVLPVAGLGLRLRPLTLTTPKNLIPVNGKPLIEYALKEAVVAGIEEVVLVISPEHAAKYEGYIEEAEKRFPLRFYLRVQEKPFGHGHALLQAADILGGEPFAVRFCDDVIINETPVFPQFLELFQKYQAPVLFLQRVPWDQVSRYGVVVSEEAGPRLHLIRGMVEKPAREEAPSNLIILGGYVLTPDILRKLKELEPKMRQENDALLLTDGFADRFAKKEPVYGWEFPGMRLDCGTLKGLEKAEELLRARSSAVASN